jgi:hypothetical protein
MIAGGFSWRARRRSGRVGRYSRGPSASRLGDCLLVGGDRLLSPCGDFALPGGLRLGLRGDPRGSLGLPSGLSLGGLLLASLDGGGRLGPGRL